MRSPKTFSRDKSDKDSLGRLALKGAIFGKLKVVEFSGIKVHPNGRTSSMWTCQCECGLDLVVLGNNLKKGNTTSCGCSRIVHGQAGEPEHVAWEAINQRCNNPNNPNFRNYGARGITMCERWEKFENFLEDMGPRPSLKHSIDRIDNNQGYFPENCRWATSKEQARNTRRNRFLTINGTTKCISEWSEICGVSPNGLKKRIRNCWPEEFLLLPPMTRADYLRFKADFLDQFTSPTSSKPPLRTEA